jgi:TRAP-type C4-dicarboxylate transport system permease small subunit
MEVAKPGLTSKLEQAALAIACVCCALLAILSLLDLLCRSLGLQFYLASEGNGFLMGWLIFFALPFTTRTRSHITVEFLLNAVSPPVRTAIEIFNHLVTLVFIGVLIWLCGKITYVSWMDGLRAQGILRIPTLYPFLGIMIGFGLFFMSQVMILAETVWGRRPTVAADRNEPLQ